VRIFQPAQTLFSLTFLESIGDASASVSTRHLWKLFRWRFASQHRLHFCWLFLSVHGSAALSNALISIGSCDVDFFLVNKGREIFRIHASPLECVSVMISSRHRLYFHWFFPNQQGPASTYESTRPSGGFFGEDFQAAPALFSLTFSESIQAARASEYTRHIWKVFRWWFLSRQQFSFRWLFLSE
jgi:hypothetical protein